MIRVGAIVVRVENLQKQCEFWAAALDYVPRGEAEGDDETVVLLRPRDGVGPNVTLDTMRSTLQVPPRIHLDMYSDDHAVDVQRLVALGATEIEWSRMPVDADYVILADPEGNRFCVIDRSR